MKTYDTFYDNAKKGTLPSFSWILPRQGQNTTTHEGPNDDHPCHDIALGERLLKDTYEALRASPKWNNTVLLVTYDDPGGWYDHASVPVDVPAPDNSTSCGSDKNVSFTWLGARVPTLLISPWVPKGTVIHAPKGPAANSVYEHSSVAATLKDIFQLPSFLTRRDAWAGSFYNELSLSEPRTDTPVHLPSAPAPTVWDGGEDVEGDDDDDGDDGDGGNRRLSENRRTAALPRHCSVHGKPFQCGDPSRAHKKQKQRMRQWSELNHVVDGPNPETVTRREADDFIHQQFQNFHQRVLDSEL